jgi:hypothetical protein
LLSFGIPDEESLGFSQGFKIRDTRRQLPCHWVGKGIFLTLKDLEDLLPRMHE